MCSVYVSACEFTVPDLAVYARLGPAGSSPARSAPRVATASVTSTRGPATSTQRTNPLSAFDTRDVSYSYNDCIIS